MQSGPNVLVIMVDQMSAHASHLWGNPWFETPNLDRLARTAVIYKNAYTPQPLCVPARIAFWTAQWPHSTGARTNQHQMPDGSAHGFKVWREAGYRTGLIGKDHCFAPSDHALFDVRCEISHYGFESGSGTVGMEWWQPVQAVETAHSIRAHMDRQHPGRQADRSVDAGRFSYAITDFPEDHYGTGLVTGQVERFLEQSAHEPFALWVSYPDPHTPYEAPRRLFEEVRDKVNIPAWRQDEFEDAPEHLRVLHQMMDISGVDPDHVRAVLACYYAMIAFIDEGVGRILDTLERLGLRDDTIVVFCSDHGDFAGEHMMMAKGGAFFDCLTKVPLIVSYPPATPARVEEPSLVNLLDVLPTLLHLQGLAVPDAMDGGLLPGVTEAEGRDTTFSEYGNGGPLFGWPDLACLTHRTGRPAVAESLRQREWAGQRMMVRRRDWKYVHDPMGGADELYHLAPDPGELHNLANDDHRSAIKGELRALLREFNPAAFARHTEDDRRTATAG